MLKEFKESRCAQRRGHGGRHHHRGAFGAIVATFVGDASCR